MRNVVLPYSDNGMRYLLLVLVVCSVGILMIPNAFAAVGNERTITVQNAPGSSVPGCEKFDGCFIPNRPSIRPGDTVVWTNPDTTAHTATSGSAADGPDGVFDSSLMMAGQTFSHQFTKSGLYNYYCMVHPWMEGIIIVKEGPDWTPPSPPSSVPTSKTSSNLILDPLPTTFNAKGSDSRAKITFSGKLESADKEFYITSAPITLKFTGFMLDGKNHYEITTDNKGKFNKVITLPPGKDYRVQAVFDGGQSTSGKNWAPSKSQTEYFIVTSTTSPSQPPISKTSTMLTLDVDSTSNRIVTFSGQLLTADKQFNITSGEIKLVFTPSIESWNNNSKRLTDDEGKFNIRIAIPPGQNYRVQAVFDGYTKDKIGSSQSLTQTFTVTSSLSSQPPTSTSSGDLGWIWILIILGVVFAGVAGVLAKKGLKKTPKATPQRRKFGVKQPKKRRTGSPASVPPSRESASTFAHYECPNCHSENVVQNPNGSEYCSDCGWKS